MPRALAKKMYLKPGCRAAVLHAPEGYLHLLEPIPEDIKLDSRLQSTYDWIWHFSSSRTDLERDIASIRAAAKPEAAIWLSYRKGTTKAPSDLKRETMWEIAGPHGLQPNMQVAVDDQWSALRFKLVGSPTSPPSTS